MPIDFEIVENLPHLVAGQTDREALYIIYQWAVSNSKKLDRVIALLKTVLEKEGELMALVDDLKVAIQKIDDDATQIGVVIQKLMDQLKNTSLTPAERDEIFTQMDAVTARLTDLGKDPTNPIPPVTPAFAAAKKKAGVP